MNNNYTITPITTTTTPPNAQTKNKSNQKSPLTRHNTFSVSVRYAVFAMRSQRNLISVSALEHLGANVPGNGYGMEERSWCGSLGSCT